MRRSLRLFCIIPFFLLFALPPTVHASLKAPRRVSSSPHILKPGEEDAFLQSQLKSSSSVTPSSTPTSGDDDRHHHQQHKHRTHEHAHRIVKKEHHKRAASHEWTDSSKEVDTKTLTATVKSSEERPHVGVYGATSSIKTASSSPSPPSPSSSSPSPPSSPSPSSSPSSLIAKQGTVHKRALPENKIHTKPNRFFWVDILLKIYIMIMCAIIIYYIIKILKL